MGTIYFFALLLAALPRLPFFLESPSSLLLSSYTTTTGGLGSTFLPLLIGAGCCLGTIISSLSEPSLLCCSHSLGPPPSRISLQVSEHLSIVYLLFMRFD